MKNVHVIIEMQEADGESGNVFDLAEDLPNDIAQWLYAEIVRVTQRCIDAKNSPIPYSQFMRRMGASGLPSKARPDESGGDV